MRGRAEKVRRAEVDEAGNQAGMIARETRSARMEMTVLRKTPKTMRAVKLEIHLSHTRENACVCEMRPVRCSVQTSPSLPGKTLLRENENLERKKFSNSRSMLFPVSGGPPGR